MGDDKNKINTDRTHFAPQPVAGPEPIIRNAPDSIKDNSVPKKTNITLLILGIASLLTIVFPQAALLSMLLASKNGVSGTEFIGLYLVPFIFVGYIVAIINLVYLVIYLAKRKPKNRSKIFVVILIIISVLYLFTPFVYAKIESDRRIANTRIAAEKIANQKKFMVEAQPNKDALEKLFQNYSKIEFLDIETVGEIDNSKADAKIDSFARLGIRTTGLSLMQQETKLYNDVLGKNGYRRSGSGAELYYVGGVSKHTGRGYVVTQYRKNNEIVAVQFIFNGNYTCPPTYVCSFTGATKPSDKTYKIGGFRDIQVDYLDIRYANNVDNNGLQFDSEYY